jgi:Ca-activated chloride channel family protein
MGLHFQNPLLLHLFWILPIQGVLWWYYWRWRRLKLRQLGSPALESRLLLGFSVGRFWLKNALFVLSIALLVVAIADPVRRVVLPAKARSGSDIILALDISNSMLAQERGGTRLQLARELIRSLVRKMENERLGLLFFAGKAFPQVPLSYNHEALLLFTQLAEPNFITDQGTNIRAALDLGLRMVQGRENTGHALILITDGEDHEVGALDKAYQLRTEGMPIFTVCMGKGGGNSLPLESGGVRTDASGKVVVSAANPSFLRELAAAGGGAYYLYDPSIQTTNALVQAVAQLQKSTRNDQGKTTLKTYYTWLVFPALLLLALEQLIWWRKKKISHA